MTLSTWFAAVAAFSVVIWCIRALVRAVKRDIDRVDDWWQPSEAGALAKQAFDEKQADKQQKKILKTINKPKYQQPNRSNS